MKDLIDIAGAVTGGGNSPDWLTSHAPPPYDARPARLRALRRGGARVVGKDDQPRELAFSLEGENAHCWRAAPSAGPPIEPPGVGPCRRQRRRSVVLKEVDRALA